jgi:HSP90 family molecular chaperone
MGVDPYIKFKIRQNTIVIEYNEDGFTPEDVKAICRIGESTKTQDDSLYYIGKNGFGFKSVFLVASKVHIQSGPSRSPLNTNLETTASE